MGCGLGISWLAWFQWLQEQPSTLWRKLYLKGCSRIEARLLLDLFRQGDATAILYASNHIFYSSASGWMAMFFSPAALRSL